MRSSENHRAPTISRRQQQFAGWMTDVLVYLVVLNLFVEYVDAVVIDSFTISIFTAVVLKAFLGAIVAVEHRVFDFFGRREGTIFRILAGVSAYSILFLSKFVILEAIDIIFGDHVELGGFITLVALIISMMVAREILQRIYERL